MRNDLISRMALMEEIEHSFILPILKMNLRPEHEAVLKIREIIMNMPAAFDKEKVIEQLQGASNDRWFCGDSAICPQDKQLCVVVLNPIIPSGIPVVCQYDAEKEEYKSQNDIYFHREIKYWKPLGLPADVEERVLAEIEKWFEEE